jgi:hypothetical protein
MLGNALKLLSQWRISLWACCYPDRKLHLVHIGTRIYLLAKLGAFIDGRQ